MALQNRVTPFGEIVATPARGSLMGNRGGRIHDPQKLCLLRRRWASRRWICCLTEFAGRHRQVMGAGYTELFFLDEVTALAAGHRPCFECRRPAARAFAACWAEAAGLERPPPAALMDALLHGERLSGRAKRLHRAAFADLPDGAMVALDGRAHALRGGLLLPWSPHGYGPPVPEPGLGQGMADLLTPPCVVAVLKAGYRPDWHESAAR